jgi:hypothetical protein
MLDYTKQVSNLLENIKKDIEVEVEQRLRKELQPKLWEGKGKYYATLEPFGQNSYIVELSEEQYKIIKESELC